MLERILLLFKHIGGKFILVEIVRFDGRTVQIDHYCFQMKIYLQPTPGFVIIYVTDDMMADSASTISSCYEKQQETNICYNSF